MFLSLFLCFFFALIAWVPIHPFPKGHVGQETDVPAINSFAIDRPHLTPNEYNDQSKIGLISAQQTQSMSLIWSLQTSAENVAVNVSEPDVL